MAAAAGAYSGPNSSQLRTYWHTSQALPVDFRAKPRPIAIVTLKKRTVSPATDLFIRATRQIARSLGTATQEDSPASAGWSSAMGRYR
jgi:hypothetical protein